MVSIRKSLGLTISEIVSAADNIKRLLNNLSFDVLYKSRLAVEENKKNIQKVQEISNNIVENELENENDIDYEYA